MSLIEEAESLMLHQFKDSSKLIGLIRTLVKPLEEVAQILQSLHHGRYIEEAEGKRLDILGRIVGQPRRDMNDEDYRAWIKVRIRINNGSGTPEDVLGIFRLLLGADSQIHLQEHPPNDVVFTFFGQPQTPLQALFDITQHAAPVGIKCHFIRADLAEPFRFDTNPFSDEIPRFFRVDQE